MKSLEEQLDFEHKANQRYTEMLIEQNHKIEKIYEIAKRLKIQEIIEIINKL